MEAGVVDAELAKLGRLERAHHHDRRALSRIIDRSRSVEVSERRQAGALRLAAGRHHDTAGDRFSITVDGNRYDKRVEAGTILRYALAQALQRPHGTVQAAGELSGLAIIVRTNHLLSSEASLAIDGAGVEARFTTADVAGADPAGLVARLERPLARLAERAVEHDALRRSCRPGAGAGHGPRVRRSSTSTGSGTWSGTWSTASTRSRRSSRCPQTTRPRRRSLPRSDGWRRQSHRACEADRRIKGVRGRCRGRGEGGSRRWRVKGSGALAALRLWGVTTYNYKRTAADCGRILDDLSSRTDLTCPTLDAPVARGCDDDAVDAFVCALVARAVANPSGGTGPEGADDRRRLLQRSCNGCSTSDRSGQAPERSYGGRVEFDADNVTQAVEYLIEFAEDRAQTASYSRVFGAAGLASPQDLHFSGDGDAVTKFMKAVHDHCLDNGLPPLDALVVHVEGPRKGFPGGGYFKVNAIPDPAREHVTAEDQVAGHAAWQAQVEQCRDWGKEHRRQRRRSG